jgi:hypothetical protein
VNTHPVISIPAGALHLDIARGTGDSNAGFYGNEKGQTVGWWPRAGRFVLAGRHNSLARNFGNSPHAVDGNARKFSWRITEHDAASASIVLELERGHVSFAYRAEQHIALTSRCAMELIGLPRWRSCQSSGEPAFSPSFGPRSPQLGAITTPRRPMKSRLKMRRASDRLTVGEGGVCNSYTLLEANR